MRRNKYLEDLGLKPNEYSTNFTNKIDKRQRRWKNQRRKYGFDEREVWNLDKTFTEWLYSHLMMYKEKASQIIDLNYYKISWQNKEITLESAINILLDVSKRCLIIEDLEERRKAEREFYEHMELWGKMLPCM